MRPPRVLAIVVATAAFGACATNPATGKKQLSLVSESQEIQMGKEAADEVKQTIGLVDNPGLQDYVNRIGQDLAHSTERPNLPWSFAVVDDPTPNAFALPGGYIFVTRGLLTLMRSEAELATVVGHEIGHVTARHSVQQISKQQIAQIGLGVGTILSPQIQKYGNLLGGGLSLLFLQFSRDNERQADDLGFKYALGRGYTVSEMANVFRSLGRVSPQGGAIPTFLQTHPSPGQRVQTVTTKVEALPPNGRGTKLNRDEYLHALDGVVYGDDPREGFFRGTEFVHPTLKFRFAIPDGWKGQNTKEAVLAGSADGNAALQLTTPQAGSAREAASKFATQQGVTMGEASAQTINGVPAVVGKFQATSDSGPVGGLAAWLDYGGHTYELLTYTAANAYPQQEGAFRKTIESFGPENDPGVLHVKPKIMSIVSVSNNETLAQFNQRQPSTIPIEELAVINEAEGPNTTLPSGSLAKRVTGGSALPSVK